MRVELLEIDTRVFGASVLEIRDFEPDAVFADFEKSYLAEHKPVYVQTKIPIQNLTAIQALEKYGFGFVECQIKATKALTRRHDTGQYGYSFERVTSEKDLTPVLEIAATTFEYDRLTVDPRVGKANSGERYRQFVRKSFQAEDEAVYRLYDPRTLQTVAFKTHRYLGNNEAMLLLGGVHPSCKGTGLGPINGYYEFNELIRKGIRRIYTHVSLANFPVVNLEISGWGYRVLAAYVVLRKTYE